MLERPFGSHPNSERWRSNEVLNFISDDMRRNPYPLYAQMRSVSPVLAVPGGEIWLILDYEGVKRALHDHDTFSSRAAPPGGAPLDWMIFSDPPRHTKLRSIVVKAFTPRSIAGLEPRIRELSRELVDRVLERGEMDLCADYAVQLPLMVIAEMLGIPIADRERFKRWSDAILNLSQTIGGGEAGARAAREFGEAREEIRAYLAELLPERRRTPKDDLLTRLVEAEVDGQRLSEDEILDFFLLLLLAGSETTTNLITNAILCFLDHPSELARVGAAPDLWPSAIEEVLRHRSPLQAVFRTPRRDVEMGGQVIPAGKLVLAMVGSANRDPEVFEAPERFDVGRDPNPHVAFGHGIHFCIGASLARLEAKVALPDLVSRLRGLRLASDTPWEPRTTLHVHGPTRLPVQFEPGSR
jgi:cytochrome P450